MNKLIKGGMCAGQRTYITAVAGIISAIAAFIIGDVDIFITAQAVFTFGAIFFVRKKLEDK